MSSLCINSFNFHAFIAAQSISSPSGKLSLKLASSYELRKQGVLEVSSTDNNGSIATYGLVWKVTVNDSLEYYIPQVCTYA